MSLPIRDIEVKMIRKYANPECEWCYGAGIVGEGEDAAECICVLENKEREMNEGIEEEDDPYMDNVVRPQMDSFISRDNDY